MQFQPEMNYYANNTEKRLQYDGKYILALNEMFYMGDEHKFMYDENFLREFLAKVGFKNITRTHHGKSLDSVFHGIDPHQDSQVSKISLCIEAEK